MTITAIILVSVGFGLGEGFILTDWHHAKQTLKIKKGR